MKQQLLKHTNNKVSMICGYLQVGKLDKFFQGLEVSEGYINIILLVYSSGDDNESVYELVWVRLGMHVHTKTTRPVFVT